MVLVMLFIAVLFVPPLIVTFGKMHRKYLGLALIFFALTVVAGLGVIKQSRSSNAAIGIIFLPFYGAVAGTLGWAFGNLKGSAKWLMRLLGWVCLLVAVGGCKIM